MLKERISEIVEKFKMEVVPQNDIWQGTEEGLRKLLVALEYVDNVKPKVVIFNCNIGQFMDDVSGEILSGFGYEYNHYESACNKLHLFSELPKELEGCDSTEFWILKDGDEANSSAVVIDIHKERDISNFALAIKGDYIPAKYEASIYQVDENDKEYYIEKTIVCRTKSEEELLRAELAGELDVVHEFMATDGEVHAAYEINSGSWV